MADVFVSYSRRDGDFVRRLAEDLQSHGKDVWVDVDGIRDAEKFPEALRRAIEGSDAFLFVISPDSVASEYCGQEVAHASELNKRIVPLALHEVPDEQIPEEIRLRNWIPVGESTAVDRVVTAIDTDLAWEQQHTRITVKALEWDASGRDKSFLLRGSDLAAAERWLAEGADKDPGPTALEQEYLLAGRQAASRRQRAFVGGSMTVAVIAVGLLIFALISRGQAVSAETTAKSQSLAAVSENQQAVDPERAVLLAMAAVRTRVSYGTNGTMFALRAALDASTIRYRLPSAGPQACPGPGTSYDPAPGSNLLVEGLCGGSVVFANATTGHVERTVHVPGAVASLRFTGDGSALVVGAGNRVLELDPVTGAVLREAPFEPAFIGYAVDPRAPVVAIAARQDLDFWNLTTGRLMVTHPRRLPTINDAISITYSPDGRELAVAYASGPGAPTPGLVLYDIATQRIVATEAQPASAVEFSPDGRSLAVGEDLPAGGSIVLLDSRTLAVERRFPAVQAADVTPDAVAFSPDGGLLAYGFADGTAGLVSASTGQPVDSYLGDTAAISAISFTPDGRLVATASADGTTRAWRVGGLALRAFRAGDNNGRLEGTPGGFVALGDPGLGPGAGVVVQQWRDDGRAVGPPLVLSPTPAVDAAFLSPGGRFAGVIPAPRPRFGASEELRIWNVSAGHIVWTVPLSEVPSGYEPGMSADGAFVVMNVGSMVSPTAPPSLLLLNVRTGRARTLSSSTVTPCSSSWDGFTFSPGDRLVAAGTFCGQVAVWNVATGKQVGSVLDLGGQLSSTAFSSDGRDLAVASWDGTIKVTPVPITGQGVTTLTENTKGVPLLAYSPDGRYLASAGLDHTVRIFDAHTLSELRVIAQPEAVNGVVFTDGSDAVLSWSPDNNVWLWDACTDCENPSALVALAHTRVTRALTQRERAEFGVG